MHELAEITSPNPVIDLFAGVGGLSLGASRAGFGLRLAVEKDAKAFAAHGLNFPGTLHSQEDVSGLNGDRLLNLAGLETGQLGGLIGGPPCQGFSAIGRRDSRDARNSLFEKFFSLVREARPKFFLAENVPGIMDDRFREIRDRALDHVSDYTVLAPFEVCAADFGAPTLRRRIIFFGYRADSLNALSELDFAKRHSERVTVASALSGLPVRIPDEWDTDATAWRKVRRESDGAYGVRIRSRIPEGVGHPETVRIWQESRRTSGCIATRHDPKTIMRFSFLEPGERDRVSQGARLDPKGFCPTLRAGTGSDRGSYQAVRPIHPTEARVITPREAARLQGFPDWFRFDPTKWHSFRQIGNSVSPILAEGLLRIVRDKIKV